VSGGKPLNRKFLTSIALQGVRKVLSGRKEKRKGGGGGGLKKLQRWSLQKRWSRGSREKGRANAPLKGMRQKKKMRGGGKKGSTSAVFSAKINLVQDNGRPLEKEWGRA